MAAQVYSYHEEGLDAQSGHKYRLTPQMRSQPIFVG